MAVSAKDMEKVAGEPQNACVEERQERINPGLTGIRQTFTGNFLVASPGKLFGPFDELKDKPMTSATGFVPEHSKQVKSSELCASCHTVHLPVFHRDKAIGRIYEQATYPEWAFSGYRTGETVDGVLPLAAGDRRRSPAKAATCRARTHADSLITARSRPFRNTPISRRPSTRCRRRTSISPSGRTSPSIRWSVSISS